MPSKRKPQLEEPDESGMADDPLYGSGRSSTRSPMSKRKPQPSAPSAEEMLRWMERQDARITRWSVSRLWRVDIMRQPYSQGNASTLRAAIRAAMRAEKGGRRG